MNNYDPDWQYFGFFPLKFPSKKGLKLASSRHPPPLSGLPVIPSLQGNRSCTQCFHVGHHWSYDGRWERQTCVVRFSRRFSDSLSDAYFMDECATSSAMKHVGFQHGGGYSMSNIIQPFLQPMLEATFGDSGKEVQARKTRSQATSLCIGCWKTWGNHRLNCCCDWTHVQNLNESNPSRATFGEDHAV